MTRLPKNRQRRRRAHTNRERRNRQLRFERLEDRHLLAVNILGTSNLVGSEGDTLQLNVDYTGEETIMVAWGDGNVNTFTVGGNGRPGDGTLNLPHQYLDDNELDQFQITVTGSSEAEATATATVTNADPGVSLSGSISGSSSTLFGTITDQGTLDTFTLDLNWGEPGDPEGNTQSFNLGTTPLTEAVNGINWNPATRTFSLGHIYLEADEFTIDATVTDDDGGVGTAQTTVVEIVPDVKLSASSTILEAGGGGIITASLVRPGTETPFTATQQVTVNLDFGGSADLNDDYTVAGTQIVIDAGQTSGTLAITGVPDGVDDPNETVVVDIASVIGGNELGVQRATITILEEALPEISNPAVRLKVDFLGIAEDGGVATLTATLVDPAAGNENPVVTTMDVTVSLLFSGQATFGSDYEAPTSIVIPSGSSSATATITAINDGTWFDPAAESPVVDPIESVIVDIGDVTNGVESGEQQVTTYITEPFAAGVVLSVVPASIDEGAGVATVTARLFNPLDPQFPPTTATDLTIALAFSGTATGTGGGADYAASATSIVIPANESEGSITITALQDLLLEGNETVVLDISSVTGAANIVEFGEQQVTTTILDDDLPIVILSRSSESIAEAGGVSTLTAALFDREGNPIVATEQVTVNLSFDGAATFGVDYNVSSTQIVIAAESSFGTATVTAIDDLEVEPTERVVARISGVTNAQLGSPSNAEIFIVDDDGGSEPIAEAGGPYTVAEGGSVQLDGSGSAVPEEAEFVAFAWDLDGDGIFGETGEDAARGDETGVNPTFSAAGLDGPSSFLVQLRVTIDERDSFDSATVQITNVAPSVTLNEVVAIDEFGSAAVSGSFSDPGLPDVLTLDFNWGDPNNATTSTFNVGSFLSLVDGASFVSTSGDGNILTINTVVDGTATFSIAHQYVDDGAAATPWPGGNNTLSDTATINVSITDDDLESGGDNVGVLIGNLIPTGVQLAIDGIGVQNDKALPGDTINLAGSFADLGLLDSHLLTVDWDDPNPDSVFELEAIFSVNTATGALTQQLVAGDTFNSTTDGAVLTVTAVDTVTGQISFEITGHAYSSGGLFDVSLTVQDDDDITVAVASTQAWVTGARVNDDGQLQVIGTSGKDIINVNLVGGNIKVVANFDVGGGGGAKIFEFPAATSIRVEACEGDDHVNIGPGITIPALIVGGPGNDHLKGGSGNDTILGGPGDDDLDGGAGNDVLVGGGGNDKLKGKDGNDILLGGDGADDLQGGDGDDLLLAAIWYYEADLAALDAIHAEWLDNVTYEEKIEHLTNGGGLNGTYLINVNTLTEDGEEDKLKGDKDRDLYFAQLDGSDKDKVKDKKSDEEVLDLA